MSKWQDIATLPDGVKVIGIRKWPGNDDVGVICGIKYDIHPDAVFDDRRGRWMQCTHWMTIPDDEPHTYHQVEEDKPDNSLLAS